MREWGYRIDLPSRAAISRRNGRWPSGCPACRPGRIGAALLLGSVVAALIGLKGRRPRAKILKTFRYRLAGPAPAQLFLKFAVIRGNRGGARKENGKG
jgi:hypothetical protein